MRLTSTVVAAASLLVLCRAAAAHQGSIVHLAAEPRGREVTVRVRATLHDLAPTLGVAAGVRPVAGLYRAKRDRVTANVASYITVGGGKPCDLVRRDLQLRGPDQVVVTLAYRCARRIDPLQLRYDLLFDQDPLHRALIGASGASRKVLDRNHRELVLTGHLSILDNMADFFLLGVEHIFTGYDHILFLVALLLAAGVVGGGGLRPGFIYLLGVVTSFTVAHSVTLICAALGWVALGSRVVEPAIAATITYVGIENLVVRSPRRRWLLTFVFGLVHGFGFAHILSEVGLPARGLLLSLLSFNVGVEVGQLAVVALLFPMVRLLARGRLTLPAGFLLFLLLGLLIGLLRLAGVPLQPRGTWGRWWASSCCWRWARGGWAIDGACWSAARW